MLLLLLPPTGNLKPNLKASPSFLMHAKSAQSVYHDINMRVSMVLRDSRMLIDKFLFQMDLLFGSGLFQRWQHLFQMESHCYICSEVLHISLLHLSVLL